MTDDRRRILVCSCEDTMRPDAGLVEKACAGASVTTGRQLCGAQLETFIAAAATPGDVTVACTAQQPLFEATAADEGLKASLAFVNIRETAGWAAEGERAQAKMAALIAAGRIKAEPARFVTMESRGAALILGRDETALMAAQELAEALDITVLLTGEADVTPPRQAAFPIRRGKVRTAKGHLGAFELVIDGYGEPAPSSRARLVFGATRDGAVSEADIVIDLTGGAALFPAPELREGYLRADPRNAADVERLIRRASGLTGTFDKPRYVAFDAGLCAHSRSKITGCTRCLDLCPTGAIAPAGDHVAIDPHICAGCGQCGAVCPTGAASYAYPGPQFELQRLRALLGGYRAAGRADAVVLFHDGEHGGALIDAAARFGAGLPARVLPVEVNEVTAIGLEAIAAAFAYGATHVRFLARGKARHDIAGLRQTLALAGEILGAMGLGQDAAGLIETDDPDALCDTLVQIGAGIGVAKPAGFAASGGKREMTVLALRELGRVAPTPVERIALPAGAPFGRVIVDQGGCTLCLSCVSACPASALLAAEDRPMLRFDESQCVQCGLCQATCPEDVITLEPRLDLKAFGAGPVTLKEEEPFCCIACGKPFGTRSSVERVVAKLADKHWMFTGPNARRLELIKMCEDCRVSAVTNDGLDPYAAAPRPKVRTSDDYFKEREAQRAIRKRDGDES